MFSDFSPSVCSVCMSRSRARPYLTLGMSAKRLKGRRTPTLMMPGNNDIHPRSVVEQVHCLIPNAHWAEVRPHTEELEQYVYRVLQFLSDKWL